MTIKGIGNIENLADRVRRDLGLHNGELIREIDTSTKKIAKKGASILNRTSPELTGDYRRGWTASKIRSLWVIHNRTDYQLTHLLEKPHARKGGGPDVPAQPHIRKVEEQVIDDYIKEIERILRG